MQLFILDPDPFIAARKLFDKDKVRAGKQLIETNQALAYLGFRILTKSGTPYKSKMQKGKRVTVWIGKSDTNLQWTLRFQTELAQLLPNHVAGMCFLDALDSGEFEVSDVEERPSFVFVPLLGFEDDRYVPVWVKYDDYIDRRNVTKRY